MHAQTLTRRIVFAMFAGMVLGIGLNLAGVTGWVESVLVEGVFHVVGSLFLAALRMLVVPIVFVSLVAGVVALADVRALGRIGGRALALYLATTALAISIALTLAVAIAPGAGYDAGAAQAGFTPRTAPPFTQVLIDLVPTNPVMAMAQGNMLQVIVFALVFGLAVTLAGRAGEPVRDFFVSLNAVVMKMVEWVMQLAPIGVFALIARTFATQGFELIVPLAAYFVTLVAALAVQAFVTYPVLLKMLAGLSPRVFLKKMRDPAVFAFSTASSGATIPVTLRTVEKRMGVHNSVASFTVPLGATVNMDGTAMMQGVATVFIAHVYGVDLALTDYLLVIATATLASIGTAAIPSVGLVTLTMVLAQVGLPAEGIALILGIDRLLDMLRTAVNVTGDATVSCVVARAEGRLDPATYADPDAGQSPASAST